MTFVTFLNAFTITVLGALLVFVNGAGTTSLNVRNNTSATCKCGPSDDCWPSLREWGALNSSVSGRLIKDTPAASVCYPSPQQNLAACADVTADLMNSTFVADDPIALDYPIIDSCPPVVTSTIPGNCSIAAFPVYTVDANTTDDVVKGVKFARKHNLRLVIRNTGHDLLGRSTGARSLQIWIRHLRNGLTFQETFQASDGCQKSNWTGSAFVIAGGYVWTDAYAEAAANNVILVGGGDPTVGCIGGWSQGGGHSPASRAFGLGADQVLEAQVVLQNGATVTVNACQNTDLFFAIRGGGPGTYGIVVSTTVKAHPDSPVAAQTFSMAPLAEENIPQFMEGLAILYAAFPDLNDDGFSGEGSWQVDSYAAVIGNSTTGYRHTLANFGKTATDAEAIFAPVAAKLAAYNASLSVATSYYSFQSYYSYYNTLSGVQETVGAGAALGSRLLDRKALSSSPIALRKMLNVTAGTAGQYTINALCLFTSGQIFRDAEDPNSGVNPAWRTSYLHNIVARGLPPGGTDEARQAVHDDITFTKVAALKDLAPDTGCYMNEADRLDPDYLEDFYGPNLQKLRLVKAKYDPSSLFYCPTCVGSDNWIESSNGRLCKVISKPNPKLEQRSDL